MMTTVTVPSESRPQAAYTVTVDGVPTGCTCPDHTYRARVCKHMRAVAAGQGLRGRTEAALARTCPRCGLNRAAAMNPTDYNLVEACIRSCGTAAGWPAEVVAEFCQG